MRIQSILFDKHIWTKSASANWLVQHSYKTSFYGKRVEVTANRYRYRQLAPKKGAKYRIKKLPGGIELVLEV